jgi:hypothetical protein
LHHRLLGFPLLIQVLEIYSIARGYEFLHHIAILHLIVGDSLSDCLLLVGGSDVIPVFRVKLS